MTTHERKHALRVVLAALLLAIAAPVHAQDDDVNAAGPYAPQPTERAKTRTVEISHFRPHDARALNQFEAPKAEGAPYEGFKMEWGAAFTQQFQALNHRNSAAPRLVGTPPVDANRLISIGNGFNNAEANLFLDAQLAKGIRVALTSYLSSRHHSETWVKDGYLLIDASPWEIDALDHAFEYLTLRVGHFEINYGDMHFRRTDNGQAMYNPLVGNLLMDAFTTEIGGEVYLRKGAVMAMAGVTGGEVRGQVLKPENRSPSFLGKVGFDRQFSDELRVRVTGSAYHTTESNSNTLYSGNRAGSRYYYVVENTAATEAAQAWSGDVRPGFSNKVTAWTINPFITFRGLELFGHVEQAKGRNATEASKRTWDHYAAEAVYRFLGNHVYVAGRYNVAKGTLVGIPGEVEVRRIQGGGGWFLTHNLLAKVEYVEQRHEDFPASDIRHEARFDGIVFEAVVSF
jgi:hypothetical protein